MSVTLRKASQIASAIQAAANELKFSNKIEFSIYHETNTVKPDVAKARKDLDAKIYDYMELMDAHGHLRAVIGRANASTGISDLLAADASMNATLAKLKPLSGTPDLTNLDTATQKMMKLANKEETVYGGQEVEVIFDTTQVNEIIRTTKKARAEIADKLLTLNTSTLVDLPELVQSVITKHSL